MEHPAPGPLPRLPSPEVKAEQEQPDRSQPAQPLAVFFDSIDCSGSYNALQPDGLPAMSALLSDSSSFPSESFSARDAFGSLSHPTGISESELPYHLASAYTIPPAPTAPPFVMEHPPQYQPTPAQTAFASPSSQQPYQAFTDTFFPDGFEFSAAIPLWAVHPFMSSFRPADTTQPAQNFDFAAIHPSPLSRPPYALIDGSASPFDHPLQPHVGSAQSSLPSSLQDPSRLFAAGANSHFPQNPCDLFPVLDPASSVSAEYGLDTHAGSSLSIDMVGQDSDIAPIDSQDSAAPAASGSQPRCQWATCTARFNSSDELLPHISKLHLSANHLSTLWTKKEIEQIQETEANMSEAGPSAQTIDPLVDSLETEEQGLVPYGPIENPSRSFYHVCRWALCTLRSFFSIDELVRHLCNDHLPSGTSNSKPHGCLWDACSERFNTFDELTDHLSEHHIGNGSSVYVCKWKDCERHGKPFAQRQKIMRHIQTHTGDKPYQCTQCNQRFSELAIMTQHIRTHTGERPYKCPENSCGKQFAIPGALTIHIRKHTGERPFKCKVNGCEKRFAESSNLTKHVRVHTGEKPFQCPLRNCGKQFARPDQVTRHQKTHADKKKQAPI